MRRKAVILFWVTLALQVTGYGQSAEPRSSSAGGEEEPAGRQMPGSWDLALGTGISHIQGFGPGMFLYAAPSYQLRLNHRWTLHGGAVASAYSLPGGAMVDPLVPREGPMPGFFPGRGQATYSSLAVFMAASYRMTDRLVLHGSGVRHLYDRSPVQGNRAPSLRNPYASDRLSLGATYRLGDNLTLGATIHMQEGYMPYSRPFRVGGFYPYW